MLIDFKSQRGQFSDFQKHRANFADSCQTIVPLSQDLLFIVRPH